MQKIYVKIVPNYKIKTHTNMWCEKKKKTQGKQESKWEYN